MDSVGDRLRELRERMKISQTDLARAIGVHPTTVTNWESHRNRRAISEVQIGRIAKALGVPLSELVNDVDPQQVAVKVASLTITEKVLLDIWRRLPSHVQTVQLAQLIECERLCRLDDVKADAARHEQ